VEFNKVIFIYFIFFNLTINNLVNYFQKIFNRFRSNFLYIGKFKLNHSLFNLNLFLIFNIRIYQIFVLNYYLIKLKTLMK